MKYIKLFEEMELVQRDDFQPETPSHNFKEGDLVDSYRGKGTIIELGEDFAKVQLKNSKDQVVRVPLFALTPIEQADLDQLNIRDTQAELSELVGSAQHYYDYIKSSAEYADSDEEMFAQINVDSVLDFIEEALIEVLSIRRNDNAVSDYDEYHTLINLLATLADLVVSAKPEYTDRVDNILANFPN